MKSSHAANAGLRSSIPTGLLPLDRVLGGGLVEGSITLFAGWPGTGKTTLTLQMLDGLGERCLYATGEETRKHVIARARRIGALSKRITILASSSLEEILAQAHSSRAQAIAIDTIQILNCGYVKGRAGNPPQLRACTARLIDYARTTGVKLWLVGHLTARGDIAGPRTLEHNVDVVLRLDQEDDERILRCSEKNRFGSSSPVGHLKLTAAGFVAADESPTRAQPVVA